jgi:hypothetical protein
MSLESEIEKSARKIATDSYDMSIGELINLYRDGDLIVNPEFQRLFRWDLTQKSHLIESILIGVPLPNIFVFETKSGKWELVDGLQRVSTILEFVGILKKPDETLYDASVLAPTRYLPSLEGFSWDGSQPGSKPITASLQISIKRARIGLQILKKSSDEKAKFDLFQRLNSYGSVASRQELRNCIMYMQNMEFFKQLKALSEDERFIRLMNPTDTATANQQMMDYVTRFVVFNYIEYDKRWDIEEYLDNGIIEICDPQDEEEHNSIVENFTETLEVMSGVGEHGLLKKYRDGKFSGRVGQAAFEAVFLGVSRNLPNVKAKPDPSAYILERVQEMWAQGDVQDFSKAGLRGTDRIKKTLSFGREWFSE